MRAIASRRTREWLKRIGVSGQSSRYSVLCVDKMDAWASSEVAKSVLTCVRGQIGQRRVESGPKVVSIRSRTRSLGVKTSGDKEADLLKTWISLVGRRERVGRR